MVSPGFMVSTMPSACRLASSKRVPSAKSVAFMLAEASSSTAICPVLTAGTLT